MGMICAIANQKGGTGKTTTSINLSAYLALFGNRVLLIDADSQGNATSGVGLAKEPPTLYDVLVESIGIEEAIKTTEIQGLDCITSNNDLTGIEIEMVGVPKREFILYNCLTSISDRYDIIIIDCPPSLSLITISALTASERLIVPLQAEYYALEGLAQLINTVDLVKRRLNPRLFLQGILLTMVDSRTTLSHMVIEEARTHFRDRVFSTIIPRNVKLSESPSYGKPIPLYAKGCPGDIAYYAFAKEAAEALNLPKRDLPNP